MIPIPLKSESFRFLVYPVKLNWMENLRMKSGSPFDINYHFVWVTKYQKRVLQGEVGGEVEGSGLRDMPTERYRTAGRIGRK